MVEVLAPQSRKPALKDITLKVNSLPDRDSVLVAMGDYERLQVEKAALSKREKQINQRLKNAGGQIDAFKSAMNYRKHKDGDSTCMTYLAHLQHYLKVFNMPIGSQLGLFDSPVETGEASQEAKLKAAFQAGYDLGLMGKSHDAQAFPENTDLGQEHLKGWHAGQAVMHERFLQWNKQDEEEAKSAEQKKADREQREKEQEEKRAQRQKERAEAAAAKEKQAAERKALLEKKKAESEAVKKQVAEASAEQQPEGLVN